LAEHFVANLLEALPIATACYSFSVLFLLFSVVLFCEWRAGRHIERYLEASFRVDVLYTVLIIGGVYNLFQQPLINRLDSSMRQSMPFLYLNLLDGLPDPVRLGIFVVAVDFCRYWKHRGMHSIWFLKPIHSIHHAPTSLNLLTAYRIHIIDI
jgi:sterol desaturase/sphingolipid hydroxylase (fatty acid hydroxylase superfamily)